MRQLDAIEFDWKFDCSTIANAKKVVVVVVWPQPIELGRCLHVSFEFVVNSEA